MTRDRDEHDEPELLWFYLDATGREFGPYPASAMRNWYDRNLFHPQGDRLRVRLPEWDYYMSVINAYSCERGAYFIDDPSPPLSVTSFPTFARMGLEPERASRVIGAHADFLESTEDALIESPMVTARRGRSGSRTARAEVACVQKGVARKLLPAKWSCPMIGLEIF
eukprot:TRINITY_DN46891_c0_g1_i1.p1 TRINITY_DN46891_c0_g1~~TRINITY_DN46891_c0_g1_i1.p1  ORF type:complete len:167 (+),score=14.47 TRINITY_DN46891_c0_g1_i1:101-601(+)